MPEAHPKALRQRVVDAYENGEGTYADIAVRFQVGVASVSRWLGLARRTGNVAPRPAGGNRREAVPEAVRDNVIQLINDEPNWTTTELSEHLEEALGVNFSRKQVGRLLNQEGYSFKRGSSDRELPADPSMSPSEQPSSSNKPTWKRVD